MFKLKLYIITLILLPLPTTLKQALLLLDTVCVCMYVCMYVWDIYKYIPKISRGWDPCSTGFPQLGGCSRNTSLSVYQLALL